MNPFRKNAPPGEGVAPGKLAPWCKYKAIATCPTCCRDDASLTRAVCQDACHPEPHAHRKCDACGYEFLEELHADSVLRKGSES